MKIDSYLSHYTKLKSKWIKDVNRKTQNLIDVKVGTYWHRVKFLKQNANGSGSKIKN